MPHATLKITKNEDIDSPSATLSSRKTRELEMQAKFERQWLLDPEQFNPLRNCMERERLDRTWTLLLKSTSLEKKKIADIGCGSCVFSRRLRDFGATVECIDIAENALKEAKKHNTHHMTLRRETMPMTKLPDNEFDIVVCMELIAELSPEDFRLFFAELARIVKSDGLILCSTPIDIDTDGGVQRLIELAQTELDIIDTQASYYGFYIHMRRFLKTPTKYIEAWRNAALKEKTLNQLHGIAWMWFYLNTSFVLIWFWLAVEFLSSPLESLMRNNRWLLLKMEKICQFFSSESGISHFIFIGKRRPIIQVAANEIPVVKPKKREVWE